MREMGRPKGGQNGRWSKEQKVELIQQYLGSGMGRRKFATQEGISDRLFFEWIRRYMEDGEAGLEHRKKTGNPYAALHTSKSLSEIDRLRLTVTKQEVEIARLKKGYWVERSGANKVFVTSNGKSIR